jgi:hypothetical protein
MKMIKVCVLVLLIFAGSVVFGQTAKSGRQYYLTAVHNGNRVMTIFGNYGVIGQPATSSVRGSWKYPSNGYIGDVSLFVGAEIQMPGNVTFHSVVSCPVERPTKNKDTDQSGNDYWTFMPQEGYASSTRLNGQKNQSVAMNIDPESWPKTWPDKLTDANDPGWPAKWNGYFGKRSSADQESYFVMDDNNDVRYNFASNNSPAVSFKPDSTNLLRNGLGIVVRVRGLQWNQTLAQDNIFWLYEIENTGTATYNRAIFGMLVGTYVGVSGPGSDRYAEYDDDWSFYDVNENITYTGDYPRNNSRNPFWQGPVGMVGYAFLESPGNPFDGIDNDDDVAKYVPASTLPKFKSTDFDSVVVKVNDKLVVINNDFSRTVITVPSSPFKIKTRGRDSVTIIPGTTKLSEGGTVKVGTNDVISASAYDGVDNDFDGIIDENVYLHYRQYKADNSTSPPQILIDVLRPVRYFDYKTLSYNAYSMIDERRDDGVDNDKDWDLLFDDTGKDGIFDPLNLDQGEKDGVPTEGERNFDSRDVDESDQIGLTSFVYFTNSGDMVDLRDDEDLWKRMQPGTFSVPSSIVLNKPIAGEDGDFIYGSGFFPLLPKKTEFLSLALVYGGGNDGSRDNDIADLLKHKKTVQDIYNANYQFPIAPDPAPTLTAVAGDGNVKLYWDRRSENAVDPVLRYKDFQGYKIFKATDRTFNDAFVVTNADGIAKGFKSVFQVDLVDSVLDYFYPPKDIFEGQEGFTYYMGKNSGLVHEFTDTDVMNGRTYYYAIVAYDNGDFNKGIMPSQNSWNITTDEGSGKIQSTSSNVAVVIPRVKSLGYVAPSGSLLKNIITTGTGKIQYNIVDENKVTGNTYVVTFKDTRDSGKMVPSTTTYTVLDSLFYSETVVPGKVDTLFIFTQRKNFVPGSVTMTGIDGTVIPSSKYLINYERGALRAKNPQDLQPDPANLKKYTIQYRYYPIYRSVNINSSPYVKETKDTDIFDGVQLAFTNDWDINLNDTLSGFNNQSKAYLFTFSTVTITLDPNDPSKDVLPTRYPADYDIIFSNSISDTSDDFLSSPKIPVNFTIKNRTDNKSTRFLFDDQDFDGKLGPNDNLLLYDRDGKDSLRYTWFMNFNSKTKNDTVFTYVAGDTLKIRTTKPFRSSDIFSFSPSKPFISKAVSSKDLENIRVVPNPYVVASIREEANYGAKFGRGERKIEFQHVPSDSKISIFTVRGELVRVLRASGVISTGTVSWDIKSDENLDVAFGVYFYAVESSVGTKTGKIAIIK